MLASWDLCPKQAVFQERLSARRELEGATGTGLMTAECSVTSLHRSNPDLKGQGEKIHYGVIAAEIGAEGSAWGLLNWSFVNLSLFVSYLPWERLPVILDSVAPGMLCIPSAAAMGYAGLKCPMSPSCREVALAAAAASQTAITRWGTWWQE